MKVYLSIKHCPVETHADIIAGAVKAAPQPTEEHATNQAGDNQDIEGEGDGAAPESVFQLHIELPHAPNATSVMCSTHEYDRQIVVENRATI